MSLGRPVSPSEDVSLGGVPPGAHVFDHHLRAALAVHRAAPVELAVATAHDLRAPLLHPQAAVVTQPPAAAPLPLAQAVLVLHALPALGAVQAQAGVRPAVVRRLLQVDELRLGDASQRVHDGALVVRAVELFVQVQLLGFVVLGFQVVSDLSEIGQLRPAGSNAAALRHAVAPAHALHGRFHSLLLEKHSGRSVTATGFTLESFQVNNW